MKPGRCGVGCQFVWKWYIGPEWFLWEFNRMDARRWYVRARVFKLGFNLYRDMFV